MCGIAGIIVKHEASITDIAKRLKSMAQSMHHRGPDDEGLFISTDARIGLVNRRLAIRDLSPTGHMPMCNPAQSVWITYNGEVYNANELRLELEAIGYIFNSSSDTEVILHGYEAWGIDVVNRLRGMFAFTIYDEGNSQADVPSRPRTAPRVLIARDHMGIKPLYYAETAQAIIFASELKTLLASDLVSKEISATAVYAYLLTGSVPQPYTIYQDVVSLQPASMIEIDWPVSKLPCPSPYWQLPTDINNELTNFQDVTSYVRELLKEAVSIRLVSDVPLGAFLSGGLDSSAVVALMRQASSGPVRTCSMIFEEAQYSEAPYARAVSEMLDTEHYERVITVVDLSNEFENILKAMDQPSIDGVNTYFVSKTAREAGLTVALSGIGGDELFGGYPNTFKILPRLRQLLGLVQHIPTATGFANSAINLLPQRARLSRIQDALHRPASFSSAYAAQRGLFSPSEIKSLVTQDFLGVIEPSFHLGEYIESRAGHEASAQANPFAWTSRAELRNYTNNQLIRDTDIMSMAHSLEVREPLLDKCLVESVLRLPNWAKSGNTGINKPLLLQSIGMYLPNIVTERRDKQGFTFPFALWMRGSLKGKVDAVMDELRHAPWIKAESVDDVRQGFYDGKIHWSRLWALVVLQGHIS